MNGQGDELERLAVEELLHEAKRAKERSQTMGTYGWQKRKATTNKRFLHNTLVSTLRDYKMPSNHHSKNHGHVSQRKDSKWSTSHENGGSFKPAHDDAIFHESTHNSKSRKDSAVKDENPTQGDIQRITDEKDISGKLAKDKIKDLHQTEESPAEHRQEEKGKHGKRNRSRSPFRKELNGDDRVKHETVHHQYRERRQVNQTKRSKHKDRSYRSDNPKT